MFHIYWSYHEQHLQKQAKELTRERDSIVIEEEDSLKDYYNLLQQYRTLKKDVHDIVLSPKYCLPYLQPGRLVSLSYNINDKRPSFCIQDQATWGIIINFQKINSFDEGKWYCLAYWCVVSIFWSSFLC